MLIFFNVFWLDILSLTIIVSYDGVWKQGKDSWSWINKIQQSKLITIRPSITFHELIKGIYVTPRLSE